jgi:hypothetical protein
MDGGSLGRYAVMGNPIFHPPDPVTRHTTRFREVRREIVGVDRKLLWLAYYGWEQVG